MRVRLSSQAAAVQTTMNDAGVVIRELVERCQKGDTAAFEELVKRFERKVFGLVYQIVRSANDVEDIAQEVFTKLFFSLPQFRLEASFDAWLYRITVNQCCDYLRKRRRTPQLNESELSAEEAAYFERVGSFGQSRPIDISRRLEMRQIAANLLSALSPAERSLLVLKEVEELSIEELMGIFKASKSAIKVRLFRARRRLKSLCETQKKGKGGREPEYESSPY
jgi:RNA polymerase sigma-70 factor, ECF subfamily